MFVCCFLFVCLLTFVGGGGETASNIYTIIMILSAPYTEQMIMISLTPYKRNSTILKHLYFYLIGLILRNPKYWTPILISAVAWRSPMSFDENLQSSGIWFIINLQSPKLNFSYTDIENEEEYNNRWVFFSCFNFWSGLMLLLQNFMIKVTDYY